MKRYRAINRDAVARSASPRARLQRAYGKAREYLARGIKAGASRRAIEAALEAHREARADLEWSAEAVAQLVTHGRAKHYSQIARRADVYPELGSYAKDRAQGLSQSDAITRMVRRIARLLTDSEEAGTLAQHIAQYREVDWRVEASRGAEARARATQTASAPDASREAQPIAIQSQYCETGCYGLQREATSHVDCDTCAKPIASCTDCIDEIEEDRKLLGRVVTYDCENCQPE